MHRNQTHVEQGSPQGSRYYSQGTQQYAVQHDFDGPAKLTTTLAHAISDVTGIDVTDTERTLTDHVEPAALDALFKPREDDTPRMNGQLTFRMWGHQVSIHSDGQILIVPPEQTPHAQVY